MKTVELTALILKYLSTTSRCIWFLGFRILSFYSRDCSLQFHTCSYLCIPPDAFINHPEFETYFYTPDFKKTYAPAHSAP